MAVPQERDQQAEHSPVGVSMWVWRPCVVVAFALLMASGWSGGPGSDVLLGPLGLLRGGPSDACSVVVCAILVPMLLSFPLRPHLVTCFLSLIALVAWLFFGFAVNGMGC